MLTSAHNTNHTQLRKNSPISLQSNQIPQQEKSTQTIHSFISFGKNLAQASFSSCLDLRQKPLSETSHNPPSSRYSHRGNPSEKLFPHRVCGSSIYQIFTTVGRLESCQACPQGIHCIPVTLSLSFSIRHIWFTGHHHMWRVIEELSTPSSFMYVYTQQQPQHFNWLDDSASISIEPVHRATKKYGSDKCK